MTPEQWRQITAVFHGALAREPAARHAFLDEACANDVRVRAEVDRLLVADQGAGQFGDAPVARISSLPSSSTSIEEPPSKRPRLHPFLVFAGIAAIGTCATFLYATWLLTGGTSPSFGWTGIARGGLPYVADVHPAGPAAGQLNPGDRLVRMNGRPPARGGGAFYFHRRALSPGDTYELVTERNGQQRTHRLTVVAVPNTAGRYTMFFVSLVWCVVGLFIGFARPESPLPRLACLAALATGLVFLQVGVINSGPLWQPLHMVLGFHFFARFPTGRPTDGIRKWALCAMYILGALVAVPGLLTHASVLAVGPLQAAGLMSGTLSFIGRRINAGMLAGTGAALGMVLVIPWNYRRLTDEDHRRRVRWVMYVSMVALLPQIWWSAVTLFERFVGPAPVSEFSLIVNSMTVFVPIVVAYAVVKHRVLDIRVVVRRSVQYVLARRVLHAAVALPIAVLAYTVASQRHLTIAQLVSDTRGYLFWLAAAALALKFQRPIRLAIDRRFFREEYDREQLLLGMMDDVGRVESIADLSRVVSDRLTFALHPTDAYVWYRDPGELAAAASSHPQLTLPDVPLNGRWLTWLEDRGVATDIPAAPGSGLSPDETRWFADRGITLIVPIKDSGDRLAGALLLGDKKSDEPYSPADKRLLSAIAKQAAAVREHLRLRERVSDQVRVRHEVLARLDGRLPDLLKECPACGACYDGIDRCLHDGEVLTLSLPVARTIDGKYRLDRLIGKGGMGAVYAAWDLRLDRPIAVKIMLGRAFGQQAAVRRFRREARAAGRVNHSNIVAVYDVGLLEGGGAYLVMERVAGVTLRAELARQKSMTPSIAADWFDPLLDGIAVAHAAGIVHRDLKPENVMGRRDGEGMLSVKVLDLGLAKFRSGEAPASGAMTAEGVVMGTLGYMSPEQLLGREVDERTDIFATAVMVIEALTGKMPFQHDQYVKLSPDVVYASCDLPGSSTEARALSGLLRRCLAVDARDRLASARALRDELVPLLRECPPLQA